MSEPRALFKLYEIQYIQYIAESSWDVPDGAAKALPKTQSCEIFLAGGNQEKVLKVSHE